MQFGDITEIEALERELLEKAMRLSELRRAQEPPEILDYEFIDLSGELRLSDFFGTHDRVLVIHNMGQACRYCTLWADGLNGVLPHLESAMSVVLVSKDPPEVQRRLALDRGWRFRMASHGGAAYMSEQCRRGDYEDLPGAAVYERRGDKIVKRGSTLFGPGDLYCPVWHLLGLAGIEASDWTAQFHYWHSPAQLEDGGENRNDV